MKLMKRILSIFSLAAVIVTVAVIMTSCSRNPQALNADKASIISPADTAGLADFQAWKAQNELAEYNAYKKATMAANVPAKAPVRTVYKTRAASNSSGSMSSESSHTAKAPVKKGWSKAAKGAVIGGAGGAIAGAVINKRNRAVGAVIGGVVGAGGGYAIGRGMDKRDGRF
jgi:hypothetical protein